jgi:hypothetical protein
MVDSTVPVSFKRKVIVTKCADPTVVVEYASTEAGIRIVEFQGVYVVYYQGRTITEGPLWQLAARLHAEMEYTRHLEEGLETEEQAEIEDAERRAGWDPNP